MAKYKPNIDWLSLRNIERPIPCHTRCSAGLTFNDVRQCTLYYSRRISKTVQVSLFKISKKLPKAMPKYRIKYNMETDDDVISAMIYLAYKN